MTAEKFFLNLLQHYSRRLPFVCYRKPGTSSKIKAILQRDTEIYTTTLFTESGFVFAPFKDEKESILIPLEKSEFLELEPVLIPKQDISVAPSPSHESTAYGEISGKQDEKQQHIHLIEKAVKSLEAGDMEKVVLSRKETVELSENDPIELFKDLLASYPTAFVYCWFHPEIGLWLGATPETLIKVEGLNFETMALAGTQKDYGSTEVRWGAKEKQEQQYVTDAIQQELSSLSQINSLELSEPFTSQAGTLLHLCTKISGRLNSAENLQQIIRSLHPTPAVCGLPKGKAKGFILQEEGYEREFYTGFLGELNFVQSKSRSRNRRNTENLAYASVRKKSSLFVNLRCMKLEDQKAFLYIGGGITKDSIPEDEWQETVNKAQTMKKVLG